MDNQTQEAAESYEATLIRQRIEETYSRRLELLKVDVAGLRGFVALRSPEIQRSAENLRSVVSDDNEAASSPDGKRILKELTGLEKSLTALAKFIEG